MNNTTITSLTAIRDALTALAVARVDATARPATGFTALLDTLDTVIDEQGTDPAAPGADYRLGLIIGHLSHLAGCRIDPTTVAPTALPIDYPPTPVGEAALHLRSTILDTIAPGD